MKHTSGWLVLIVGFLLPALLLSGCQRERPAPTPVPAARTTPGQTPVSGPTATLAPGQTRVALPTTKPGATAVATVRPGTTAVAPVALGTAPVAPAPLISPTPAPPKPIAPVVATAQPPQAGDQGFFVYKVVFGDSLGLIARKFNVTSEAIMTLNRITDPDMLQMGQELRIPGEAPLEYGGTQPYTVRAGDTLSSIAVRFGVSMSELQTLNKINDPDSLRVGQELRIPASSTQAPPVVARTHTVSTGQTLSTIAQLYGVTVSALQAANNIFNANAIYVGQVLRIP